MMHGQKNIKLCFGQVYKDVKIEEQFEYLYRVIP